MKKQRILMADDHGLVRWGAREVLHSRTGWCIHEKRSQAMVNAETQSSRSCAEKTKSEGGERRRGQARSLARAIRLA